MNWKGTHCCACDKPLQEGDDIVVCPECGAPYHRACYQKNGKCVFADKHGAGFEYKRPAAPGSADAPRCPNCGTPNATNNLFCENCGVPLGSAPRAVTGAPQASGAGTGSGAPQLHQAAQFPGIPEETVQALADSGMLPRAKEYDGIATEDWVKYIGASAPYYLFQYDRMDATHRKTSVCWSALLFSPLYFLYRKMWGWGVFSALLSLFINIPSVLYMLQTMNLQLGFVLPEGALFVFSMVCVGLNWAASVFFGLYAFHLFRKHAAKRMQAMKSAALSDTEYQERLTRSGGPSRVAVAALVLVLMALSYLFLAWLGPENISLYGMYA